MPFQFSRKLKEFLYHAVAGNLTVVRFNGLLLLALDLNPRRDGNALRVLSVNQISSSSSEICKLSVQ